MLHCNKWILRITLWNLKLNKPLLIDHSFEDWDWEGVPNFRMEQVRDWIFEKGQLDWGKMSNLPKSYVFDKNLPYTKTNNNLQNHQFPLVMQDILVVFYLLLYIHNFLFLIN